MTFGRAPLSDVIRRRGSTRAFDPAAVAPAELLVHAFAAATAPLQADFLEDGGTLLDHHVLVHAVDGVEAGGYRWTGDGFERVDAYGDTRRVGRHLTLNQDLGGDGCYTAFHGADLDAVLTRLGTRGYRCAQLEAGVVEGRLHLAAFALGFGASGLTFFDDAVRRHFATRSWPMLCTAVGRPAYRSRAGGLPGAPTRLG